MLITRRRMFLAIGTVICGFLLAGIMFVVCGVNTALQAERTLHTEQQVLAALGKFVRSHPGEWPKNWAQLGSESNFNDCGHLKWPEDSQEIKSRVNVDFDLSLEEVAKMDATNFSAVSPIGPYYPVTERWIDDLLEAVQAK